MTVINEVLSRLRQHAGLAGSPTEIPRDTLAELVLMRTGGETPLELPVLTEEIIQSLQRVNPYLNQGDPQEESRRQMFPSFVYAVSGIVLMCLQKAMEIQQRDLASKTASDLLEAAWRIQCAWDAFLAGDIDDLPNHVLLEANARGFSNWEKQSRP